MFPESFDAETVLIFGQLVDRCAVTVSHISFARSQPDLLWTEAWGISHDGWNSVRGPAKSIHHGSLWKCVVRLSAIVNFPHGPFRSGAWGKLLTEGHARAIDTLQHQPQRFDDAVARQQRLDPSRNLSRVQWWLYFSSLPMCTNHVGTILKFSRWYSANQAWAELRPQFYLVWLVFEEIADNTDGLEALAGEALSLWDQDTAAAIKGGRVANTHKFFTEELVMGLDAFVLGSSELSTSHRVRTKSHLTCDEHVEDLRSRFEGGWADEAQRCLDKGLNRPERNFFNSAVPPPQYAEEGATSKDADRLLRFTVGCLAGWLARTLPTVFQLPESAAHILVDPAEGVKILSAQCHALVSAEKIAKANVASLASEILGDIAFIRTGLVRLILFTAAADEARGTFANTVSLVKRAITRLPDE